MIMAKSTRGFPLKNVEQNKTPCCKEPVSGIFLPEFTWVGGLATGTGTIDCEKCEKSYSINFVDSLITSTTPIEDAIA